MINEVTDKYYVIKKKTLAHAINFVTGMQYKVLKDRFDDAKEFYSFENNELFKQALTELTQLQNKLKVKY